MDWSRYPNFSREEFECSATGYCDMNEDFMEQVQILREVYGKPMAVTSGYRDPIEHPIESTRERYEGNQNLAACTAVPQE